MATRDHRLAEFIQDQEPALEVHIQVLCEDHVGTYVLPFACFCKGGNLYNVETGKIIDVTIVGWKPFPTRSGNNP